ncbi:hypothetical protein B5181_16755 [Streptomyces sp. 4F]|nr:hypothetical protein B5181_16755 [Streptomyces sp. 4F]
MSEAIIGGLVGGPLGAVIALLGNYFVVRDSRWGREAAAEQQAAAKLLAILRPVRMVDRSLKGWIGQWEFTEDCYAVIFGFRHHKVRQRLNASIHMISDAASLRDMTGDEAVLHIQQIAISDVRQVLEARLDRKRLPQPSQIWARANKNLHEAMEELQAEADEAIVEYERQQEAIDPPLLR